MADYALRLGLEVETVLTPRKPQTSSLEKFAKELVKVYNSRAKGTGYASMHPDIDGNYDGPAGYREWSITDDSTIMTTSDTEYPVEIVAPIMLFNPAGAWRKEVEYMFRTISNYYHIGTNTSCGTHIHISPGAGDWGTAELKSICKAIIYFECAFEVLFPKSRRGNQWAKSNRFDNRNFSSLSGQRCFELIDACHNPVEVADLMSPDRYYAWNFDNLYFGRKATIEFRRPPGVNNPDVCLAWMELTISFVQAARRHSIGGMLSKYSPDIAGLRRFVNGGLIMGISNSHLFDSIFQGKSGALQPQQVQIINKNMLMKKRKEDKRKNVMMKKLGQLSSLS